jgi:hypothetical protein
LGGGVILAILVLSCVDNSVEIPVNNDSKVSKTIAESPTSRSQTTMSTGYDCFGTGNSSSGCFLYYKSPLSYSIEVPGYGGCKASVSFDIYICPLNTAFAWKYVFTNFEAHPENSNECNSLNLQWINMINNGDYIGLNQSMDAFNKAARDAVQLKEMTELTKDDIRFHCGNSGGTAVLASEFHTLICYKWCVTVINGNPPYVNLEQIPCGDMCCNQYSDWCYNTGTGVAEPSNITYQTYGSCTGSLDPCPGSGTSSGLCQHTCAP